jgi:hypothetical protein
MENKKFEKKDKKMMEFKDNFIGTTIKSSGWFFPSKFMIVDGKMILDFKKIAKLHGYKYAKAWLAGAEYIVNSNLKRGKL